MTTVNDVFLATYSPSKKTGLEGSANRSAKVESIVVDEESMNVLSMCVRC